MLLNDLRVIFHIAELAYHFGEEVIIPLVDSIRQANHSDEDVKKTIALVKEELKKKL